MKKNIMIFILTIIFVGSCAQKSNYSSKALIEPLPRRDKNSFLKNSKQESLILKEQLLKTASALEQQGKSAEYIEQEVARRKRPADLLELMKRIKQTNDLLRAKRSTASE